MSEKTCVVVGAGPGIGLAVAQRFAREGFRIALVARRADALEGYVGNLRLNKAHAQGFPADASDPASLEGAFKAIERAFGAPEVLVYNAAMSVPGTPSALDPQQLVDSFKINVAGALVSAQQVIPQMRAARRGTILLTGGGLALNPAPAYAALAIGKAGIRSLALSLAAELAPDGIHVATVTVSGFVQPGTHFDPERIAEEYWKLHTQPQPLWEREVVYR